MTSRSHYTNPHTVVTSYNIPKTVSVCWQCTFCGRIVIKSHIAESAAPSPSPPAARCLIRTGNTWTHPALGKLPYYIEGGLCRYQRMDLGARLSIQPALLPWTSRWRWVNSETIARSTVPVTALMACYK